MSSNKSIAVLSTADFYFGRMIGEGQYGKVFHAKYKAFIKDTSTEFDTDKERGLNISDRKNVGHVAIKAMDKVQIIKGNKISMVLNERKILTKLSATTKSKFRWIASLHLSFTDDQNLYLVQELCPSGTLTDLVYHKNSTTLVSAESSSSSNPSSLETLSAQYYAAQVLCAIEFIHSHGIVHCDLKPDNIMVSVDGKVKLVDFGCAVDVETISQAHHDKSTNTADCLEFQGTADYVPPEVIRGEEINYTEDESTNHHKEKFAIDLWAYGCLVYFLFMGESPFHSESDSITFQKIISFSKYTDDERNNYLRWKGGRDEENSIPPKGLHLLDLNAFDLTQTLLVSNPSRRLGCGTMGGRTITSTYNLIRCHTFFDNFDWDSMVIAIDSHNMRKDETKEIGLQHLQNITKPKFQIDVNITTDQMIDGSNLPFDFFA